MNMFTDYNYLELKIFNGVKEYFEKLRPYGSDDYDNAFKDLIAQFADGGEDYMGMENVYDDLIARTVLKQFNKLTSTDKKELEVF